MKELDPRATHKAVLTGMRWISPLEAFMLTGGYSAFQMSKLQSSLEIWRHNMWLLPNSNKV